MTPTEKAKRSDALFYAQLKRRELCDMVSNREADMHDMRELIADMWRGMCGFGHDCRTCEHYELYEGEKYVGECEFWRRMRGLGIRPKEEW